jgi:acyl-CoA synthetase (AMP-forming)/AMP-acid ligase II
MKDVINTGGFKVNPADVELVLAKHPAVTECAVFGVRDEKWGEAVTAAVTVVAVDAASEPQLIEFVKQSLGSVKAPKRIHILEMLPRNAAGKVSRADLRAMLASA